MDGARPIARSSAHATQDCELVREPGGQPQGPVTTAASGTPRPRSRFGARGVLALQRTRIMRSSTARSSNTRSDVVDSRRASCVSYRRGRPSSSEPSRLNWRDGHGVVGWYRLSSAWLVLAFSGLRRHCRSRRQRRDRLGRSGTQDGVRIEVFLQSGLEPTPRSAVLQHLQPTARGVDTRHVSVCGGRPGYARIRQPLPAVVHLCAKGTTQHRARTRRGRLSARGRTRRESRCPGERAIGSNGASPACLSLVPGALGHSRWR